VLEMGSEMEWVPALAMDSNLGSGLEMGSGLGSDSNLVLEMEMILEMVTELG
jgi:hypothetical protein